MRGNLPAREGDLIGRADELRQTADALASAPLVTVVGAPGVGKTRLAVEAGWQSLGRYPDGVVFVDLATLAAGDGIDDAVLYALGVDPQGASRRDALLTHLRGRQLLVLLDNCEHVHDAVCDLAAAVLASCAARQHARDLAPPPEPPGRAGVRARAARGRPGDRRSGDRAVRHARSRRTPASSTARPTATRSGRSA